MSRIRTIKPEWAVNERLNRCGDAARVLSVVLITLADDHGNGRASIGYLTGQAWSIELEEDAAAAIAKCQEALTQLERAGFVRVYDVDRQRYFHLHGWREHQKISKMGKERVPGPDKADSPDIPCSSESQEIPEKKSESPEKKPLDRDLDHDQDRDRERDPAPEKNISGTRPGSGPKSSLLGLPDPLEELERVSSIEWVIRAWTRSARNLGMAVHPTQWRKGDRGHLDDLERWGLHAAHDVAAERGVPVERAFTIAVSYVLKRFRERYEDEQAAHAEGRARGKPIPFKPGFLMGDIATFSVGLLESRRAS